MKKHIQIILALFTCVMFGNIIASAVSVSNPEYSGIAWLVATAAASLFSFTVVLPAGTLANTPAATAGDYSSGYISLQDIGMPKWYSKLVAQKGDQGLEFVGMIQAMGWCETFKTDTKLIQHYEDDWIWDNFKVLSQAGGGTTATLTIDPSVIYDSKFYPGVNDVIEFPDRDVTGNPLQAIVTAIGANTIDIRMGKATWTVPATTAGQELFVGTTWFAEDTGQPASKRSTFNLFQNSFVRVKETVKMTGDAMTEQLKWQEYELVSGKKVTGIVSRSSFELDVRMMKAEQYSFLSGNTWDNVTGISGMEGMFPAMNSRAIQMPYPLWTLSAYDAMDKAQSQQYSGTVQGMLQGINFEYTNKNVMADFLKHTNVEFATKNANHQLFGDHADGQANAVTVDFSYIKYSSKRTYGFKRFEATIDPKQYGSTGYDYAGRFWVIPLKKNNIDPNTRMNVPTMQQVYRQMEGYDRTKEMWTTGSANVSKFGATNQEDNRVMNGRCQMSGRFFAVNQWVNGYQQ